MKDKLKQDKEAQEQLSEFKNNVNPHGEESVYWKRIFFENKNFEEDIDSSNIVQGRIGDCYFISYLYNLSKYAPEIFGSLFRKQDSDKGYFEINFFLEENGKIEPIIVIVDDYVPAERYKNYYHYCYIPIFAKYKISESEEKFYFGPYLLIEKAFAKINGSYFNIIGKYNDKDYSLLLTGSKMKQYYLYDYFFENYIDSENVKNELKTQKNKLEYIFINKIIKKENEDEIFDKISKIVEENMTFVGSLKYDNKNIRKNNLGIYYTHRYVLKKCKEYHSNNKKKMINFFYYGIHMEKIRFLKKFLLIIFGSFIYIELRNILKIILIIIY